MSDGVRLGRRWAHGRRFVAAVERREVGEVLVALGDRATTARALLDRALAATGDRGVRVRPAEADVAVTLAEAGIVRLEEKVEGTVAAPRWVPWRVAVPADTARDVAEALGHLDPAAERIALLDDVTGTEIVADEAALLRDDADRDDLRPPEGSALADAPWSVYAAALRAAAEWERVTVVGDRPSPRELAARVLGSSKAWTEARKAAFEQLVDQPFDVALSRHQTFVRLRGPLRWRHDGVEGDGRAATPWIGLPASTVDRLELVDCDARAVLVIENLETFEAVARSGRLDAAVLVYGGGYVSDAVVTLLRALERPVAVWCDLDPHGIGIAADIERRLGSPVHPVGMSADLLTSGHARVATAEQLAQAEQLAATAPDGLRDLALAIAERGLVCEQEALHSRIIAGLVDELDGASSG